MKGVEVRRLKDFIIAVVSTGISISLVGCEETAGTATEPVGQRPESRIVEQPATIENIEPAEEEIPIEPNSQMEDIIPAVELGTTPGPVADNNLCYACHLNFEKETLTSLHAQANIGCVQCHGASEAHRLDEDTITPPNVMFLTEKIGSFCTGCHIEDSMNVPGHQPVASEVNPLTRTCTDCHGEHRLNYRTRKWDKVTRNLIKDERVRKLSDEMFE